VYLYVCVCVRASLSVIKYKKKPVHRQCIGRIRQTKQERKEERKEIPVYRKMFSIIVSLYSVYGKSC
jgi:hypothetical protein